MIGLEGQSHWGLPQDCLRVTPCCLSAVFNDNSIKEVAQWLETSAGADPRRPSYKVVGYLLRVVFKLSDALLRAMWGTLCRSRPGWISSKESWNLWGSGLLLAVVSFPGLDSKNHGGVISFTIQFSSATYATPNTPLALRWKWKCFSLFGHTLTHLCVILGYHSLSPGWQFYFTKQFLIALLGAGRCHAKTLYAIVNNTLLCCDDHYRILCKDTWT